MTLPIHNSNKPKILLLIPNMDFGGAQRVFYEHSIVFSERYNVIECAFNMDYGRAYPTENPIISLDVPAGRTLLGKAFRFIQRCWRLHQLKKKEHPAITLSYLEGADYVSILSFGTDKKVLTIHGSKIFDEDINKLLGWFRKKFMIPLLYSQADLIVTVSEGIRQELHNYFNLPSRKIFTIYNFFPVQRLKELGNQKIEVDTHTLKPFRIITTGRLAKQKNQLPLVHIVHSLKYKHHLPIQLYFAGDGAFKSILLNECRNLNLTVQECGDLINAGNADVVFLGYQANPFALYKYMQLFVLSSAWEGFPMALGEAMISDIPVLSADCPYGPLELLAPDWVEGAQKPSYPSYPMYTPNGILLPIPRIEEEQTIEIWAETIVKVVNNKGLMDDLKKSAKARMQLLDKEIKKNEWFRIVDQLTEKNE